MAELLPQPDQLRAAAKQVCNILDQQFEHSVECGNVVTFKMDYSGDEVTYSEPEATEKPTNLPNSEVTLQTTELDQEEVEELRVTEKGVEHATSEDERMIQKRQETFSPMYLSLSALGLLFTASATVKVVSVIHQRKQPEVGAVLEEVKDAADEKKPPVDEDTASTATPASLAESATSDGGLP